MSTQNLEKLPFVSIVYHKNSIFSDIVHEQACAAHATGGIESLSPVTVVRDKIDSD